MSAEQPALTPAQLRRQRILANQKERMARIQGVSETEVKMPSEYHKHEKERKAQEAQEARQQDPGYAGTVASGLEALAGSSELIRELTEHTNDLIASLPFLGFLKHTWLLKDARFRHANARFDIVWALLALALVLLWALPFTPAYGVLHRLSLVRYVVLLETLGYALRAAWIGYWAPRAPEGERRVPERVSGVVLLWMHLGTMLVRLLVGLGLGVGLRAVWPKLGAIGFGEQETRE